MAKLTINIPDDRVEDIRDTLGTAFGYEETVTNWEDPDGPEIPNPRSKMWYIKRRVRHFLKMEYLAQKQKKERAASTAAADTNAAFENVD